MDIVASAQKTKDEWTAVVRDMISYGADIKESRFQRWLNISPRTTARRSSHC